MRMTAAVVHEQGLAMPYADNNPSASKRSTSMALETAKYSSRCERPACASRTCRSSVVSTNVHCLWSAATKALASFAKSARASTTSDRVTTWL